MCECPKICITYYLNIKKKCKLMMAVASGFKWVKWINHLPFHTTLSWKTRTPLCSPWAATHTCTNSHNSISSFFWEIHQSLFRIQSHLFLPPYDLKTLCADLLLLMPPQFCRACHSALPLGTLISVKAPRCLGLQALWSNDSQSTCMHITSSGPVPLCFYHRRLSSSEKIYRKVI